MKCLAVWRKRQGWVVAVVVGFGEGSPGVVGQRVSKEQRLCCVVGHRKPCMHLQHPGLHLLLGNTLPLEIWELHPGGCAPPNPVPVLSVGSRSSQCDHVLPYCASPCLCRALVEAHKCDAISCAPQSLHESEQPLILFKHRILISGVWWAQ